MKKITLIILIIVQLLLLMMTSCVNNKNNAGGTTMFPTVSYENLVSWATYGYDKIRGDQKPKDEITNLSEIYLAKGEGEGVQFAIRSDEDIPNVSFELKSGENDKISYKLYKVGYITINRKQLHSDPIFEYAEGEKLNVTAEQSLVLYVDFTTDKDAEAGKYEYVFVAKDEYGNEIAEYKVLVNVWNFAYPDTPYLETAFCGGYTKVSNYYGFISDDVKKAIYDVMLEHRMLVSMLPVDILSDEADAYLSDPRITTFVIDRSFSEEKMDKIYEKLSTNPEWLAKAFIYVIDEPHSAEQYKTTAERSAYYKERYPGVRLVIPFYTNGMVDSQNDLLDFLSQHIDNLCPKLNMWEDESKFPNYYERLKAKQASGEKVWTYVCNYPQAPYTNLFIDEAGLSNRVCFWQQFRMDVDGFLYWSPMAWKVGKDPYENPDIGTCGNPPTAYGDGVLIYPGMSSTIIFTEKTHGFDRKIAPNLSVRVKIIRDGLEDFDLLKMAEELFGRDWIQQKVEEITPSLTKINADDDSFAAMRIAIGNAISDAQN